MGSDEIRAIATEIASQQFPGWIAVLLLCLFSCIAHFFLAWTRKSGEIKATTERLDEVVLQTKAIADAQESIKQEIADSIWRDQKRWELEYKLYEELLVSLGKSRYLYGLLKVPDTHTGKQDNLYDEDRTLIEHRLSLLQRASLLMPADKFTGFREALSLEHIMDDPSPTLEALCEKFRLAEEASATAENFLRAHARERLGVK